jgi:hypothetical protein
MSDGLQSEAIKQAAVLAQTALQKTPKFVAIDKDPLSRYVVVDVDGKMSDPITPPPARHAEELRTVADLMAFLRQPTQTPTVITAPTAYVSEDGVTVVYDQADRRDRCKVTLTPSPAYAWLRSIAEGRSLTQRDFIRTLRVNLEGTLAIESNLLAIVRQIKFSKTADGSANIQHGRESIGKSIIAETRGEGALPDSFTVSTAIFSEHPVRQVVTVYVEPNAGDETFYVRPFPSSLDQAVDAALVAIREDLKSIVPAFLGSPN